MRISFDIDDTLVVHGFGTRREPGCLPQSLLKRVAEPLRIGTRDLMRALRKDGCSIWIYTTSGRSPLGIRFWLFLHGIQVDGVVNDERHRREVGTMKFKSAPSKYPPAFSIDLHVDDSEGVRMEGDEHNFRVVVIRPDDECWTEKVLAAARA